MVRRSYIFSGRVQGVGFRMTARSVALRHAVTGWVRNEADGSVRLEAQGEAGEVERFVAAVRQEMIANIKNIVTSEMVGTDDGEEEFVIAR